MKATHNRVFLTALLVVAAMSVAGHAQAQTTVKARVPFEFSLHGQVMPSGAYTFVANGNGPWRTIVMRNNATGKSEVVVALFQDEALAGPTSLRFHRYGHNYVLSDISIAGFGMDLHFTPTPAEREMASVGAGEVVTVLASR